MGVMAWLRDLDARGGSILPRSTEDRDTYLARLATPTRGRGIVGPALEALAREVLEQHKTIADLRARVAALENGK